MSWEIDWKRGKIWGIRIKRKGKKRESGKNAGIIGNKRIG
jgi:hypothetical protein